MLDILTATWLLIGSLLGSIASIFLTLGEWVWSVLLILHYDMPRLEGLLLGVLFAWFFVHREKNPFIRALAAPLKILLDILDIVWDETVEAIGDLLGTIKDHVSGVCKRAKDFITGLFSSGVNKLSSLKEKLMSKDEKE